MNYTIIPAALIVTLIVTFIFSLFSKRPFGGLWIFFFLLFLLTWAGQLWITPFGPVTWGIGWGSLFLIPLFFGFLMFTFVPPYPVYKSRETTPSEAGPLIALGIFFWIVVIFLIVAVALGYYRSYNPIV